jgi:hypothetical protein
MATGGMAPPLCSRMLKSSSPARKTRRKNAPEGIAPEAEGSGREIAFFTRTRPGREQGRGQVAAPSTNGRKRLRDHQLLPKIEAWRSALQRVIMTHLPTKRERTRIQAMYL